MPTSYFNDYPNAPTTPAGGLAGLTPGVGSGTPYGMVPNVPSPGSTSVDALLANINNLGNLANLSKGITDINTTNALAPDIAALPGLKTGLAGAMGNANSLIAGNIPADVLRNLQTGAAERGVATGQGAGSPNTNAAYLRALGLTTLDLNKAGQTALTGLMGSVPQGKTFDPSTMLTSPEMQQFWKYLASVLAAAPNPASKALTDLNAFNTGLGRGSSTGGTPFIPAPVGGGTTEPSWSATHPGLTPGFPNPTTTVPTGGTGVSWTNDPGFQDLFPVDPFTSEPAGTGYNAETDQSTAPDLYDLYGGWQ